MRKQINLLSVFTFLTTAVCAYFVAEVVGWNGKLTAAYLAPMIGYVMTGFIVFMHRGNIPFSSFSLPLGGTAIVPDETEYCKLSVVDRLIDYAAFALMPFIVMAVFAAKPDTDPAVAKEMLRMASFWALAMLVPVPRFNIGGHLLNEVFGPMEGWKLTVTKTGGIIVMGLLVLTSLRLDWALVVFGFTRFGWNAPSYVSGPITAHDRTLAFWSMFLLTALLVIASFVFFGTWF